MSRYRRRRSRKSTNELGVVIAIYVMIYLISRVFAFIIQGVNFLKNNMWVWVALMVLMVIIGVIYCTIKLICKRYDKIVQEKSEAINRLVALNKEFKFHSVEPMHFEHSYDNVNFYESVSEEDYLVEKLTHFNHNSILGNIRKADENKRLYKTYIDRVNELKHFRLSENVNVLFAKYVAKKEKREFESRIQNPYRDFYITVELFLTQINGRYIDNKMDKFTVEDINDIIAAIQNKDGEFYRDPRVWDAICRVERAKVSNKMRFSIYQRDGNRCCKCGSSYDLEIDHIFPISKGGKTVYENLQTLCHNCNKEKSNTIESGAYNPRFDRTKHFCPNCNVQLLIRNGKNGKFYGCPNYPKCNYTKNI